MSEVNFLYNWGTNAPSYFTVRYFKIKFIVDSKYCTLNIIIQTL